MCCVKVVKGKDVIPISFAATVLLGLVRGIIDKTRLPEELRNVVFTEGLYGLGVIVRDIICFVRTGHDCEGL